MREIKFRSWNKEKGVMVYEHEDGSDIYWDGVCGSNVEIISDIFSELEQETYEYMQYIELKDINGNGIYEGDIVTNEHLGTDKVTVTIVEYSRIRGRHVIADIYIGQMDDCESDLILKGVEIIGNKVENQELL